MQDIHTLEPEEVTQVWSYTRTRRVSIYPMTSDYHDHSQPISRLRLGPSMHACSDGIIEDAEYACLQQCILEGERHSREG